MAPRRITVSQGDHVYAPGQVGRRTGITIHDTGKRDEHGFEELDDLFSSPDKDGHGRGAGSSDDEQDMDIDDGSEMGPATTRKLQQGQNRPSLPRARSPIKTNLQSPARQNPHLGPTSSPTRGSVVTARDRSPKQAVARKLDFSMADEHTLARPDSSRRPPKVNGTKSLNGKPQKSNAYSPPESDDEEDVIPQGRVNRAKKAAPVVDEEDEEEEDEPMEMLEAAENDGGLDDESSEPVQYGPDDDDDEQDDEAVTQKLQVASRPKEEKRPGRKPKAAKQVEREDSPVLGSVSAGEEDVDEEPIKKGRGRPKAPTQSEAKKKQHTVAEPKPPVKTGKRGRPSRSPKEKQEKATRPSPPVKTGKRGRPAANVKDGAGEDGDGDSREAKRQRNESKANKGPPAAKVSATKEKGKPGRKRKSSGVGVDSPAVQRGPPLPKSRGLVTLRREEPAYLRTTRSGRASYKPLEFWKGEHVEYDAGEAFDDDKKGRHFSMRSMKNIVRAEVNEEALAGKRRGRSKAAGRKPGRSALAQVEEEIERDDWEHESGHVTGECVYWHPEYEHSPPQDDDQVEVVEEELAVSESAVRLRDIKDATFKFAKTLTLPFFGSGIVDLPPGSEKRPKNSRKMQMVFFVHLGSVQVTVSHTTFKIGQGGTWFVPRGNHYSIANESEHQHARIFFAQGCEMLAAEGVLEDE
ncbi:Mif2/CENP-C like-domain-containing protein [Xylariaceae sp. FL0804]|nr:Mif2/CENP-C like-domain-containing protein [Xylariaceae sp. FL0804]